MRGLFRHICVAALAALALQCPAAFAQDFDYKPLLDDPSPHRVGDIMEQVARKGRGKHHFLLSYCTSALGVVLSPEVRRKHPTELTIILEWRFSNLKRVGETIQVTVSFNDVYERIVVPLRALTFFSDPTEDVTVQLREGDTPEERCAAEDAIA